MDPAHWRRIEELYSAALERPAGERAAFLDVACEGDEGLRQEVEALLATPPTADGILAAPALALAAEIASESTGAVLAGRRIGVYHLHERIGAGGMGEVYRARDTRLGRDVAIKILPRAFTDDPDRLARFEREARVLAALNHPNIATIHGLEEGPADAGRHVRALVLELVEGETLAERIARGPMPVPEALPLARQIAEALEAAHEKGIVHRDLKPANIKVTPTGAVKVLDFGLAKLTQAPGAGPQAPGPSAAPTITRDATREGLIVGTAAYMSPEQARGQAVDTRTDLWAFGCVLYEMLTGRAPFGAETLSDTLAQILEREPPSPRHGRRHVPLDLSRLVMRCLQKDPAGRYQSAAEIAAELAACQARLATHNVSLAVLLKRPAVAAAAVLVLIVAGTMMIAWWNRATRVRWLREEALPQIARQAEREDFDAAFRVLKEAERYLPNDPALREWRQWTTTYGSVRTEPDGADVYIKDYRAADRSWFLLGRTPLETDVPLEYLRWRIVKAGFEPLEWSSLLSPAMYGAERYQGGWDRTQPRHLNEPMVFNTPGTITLTPTAAVPPGMVRVPGGIYVRGGRPPVRLEPFWLDRYEVTNADFKRFVDAGGYEQPADWPHPVAEKTRWAQGTGEFRDKTGRPGPSTWILSNYPDGQAELPVSGVSWYEAAAYCAFAGKSLPTVYHWFVAAGRGNPAYPFHETWSPILGFSNFDGTAPARGGQFTGLAPYGAYDMAGNVKEWVWNAADEEQRYLLGGAWNEPSYMFTRPDAAPPLRRLDTYGFRCAKFSEPPADGSPLLAPVPFVAGRDYTKEQPVSDREFALFKRHYVYDHTPLNAELDVLDQAHPQWREERVRFDAAYRRERMTAHLLLPKTARPPYQTVIYFPAGGAFQPDAVLQVRSIDFIIQSGRAAVYPIFQNTHERYRGPVSGAAAVRAQRVEWFQDLARTLDYLETRADIDRDRIAIYGFSTNMLPIFLALEPRLKVGIAVGGTLNRNVSLPEVDPFHFAPRVTVPLLMLNGRHDAINPVLTHQAPLLRVLGTSPEHKRHVTFESHHVPTRIDLMKEILAWLDEYFGHARRAR